MFYQWPKYVPVAERRQKAAAEMAKLAKKGHCVAPVVITGRNIATTVWGKAWCTNLEAYSDYANRLPRGRTYARNGSVVDLQIVPGKIEAHVSGSMMYRIAISVTALAKPAWDKLCGECAGGIDSLVELLQGRFAAGVMERLCRQQDGLFPTPKQIKLSCSCPDGAYLCKHVAAVLYGIGARLDRQPELLFTLRQVAATDLLAKAGTGLTSSVTTQISKRTLAADDIGALFGLEMDQSAMSPPSPVPVRKTPSASGIKGATKKAAKQPTKKPIKKGVKVDINVTVKKTSKPLASVLVVPRLNRVKKPIITKKSHRFM